ncbi:MAG: NAD(P)/FAD-dependent oxidoreductase [Steroidobacteraceae bacterium]
MTRAARRAVLQGLGAAALAWRTPRLIAGTSPHVVVLGGGFAGGSCARALAREGGIAVTLIEAESRYTACPFSNHVIAGLREISAQQFGYGRLAKARLQLLRRRATGVDATRRRITFEDASHVDYDRLVMAPGINLHFDALPGYDATTAQRMPHAWQAGEQTLLLRRQLEAMRDGGVVVMSVPPNPYRCPPGPYERASLIAHYLKTRKPRSKLIVLDAKDQFSKQRLFQAAWAQLYPGTLEWISLSSGGRVTGVDAATRSLVTEFGTHKADVANVIPPQRAGEIAHVAGVADRTGWCPIDPVTFESRLVPGIHVIGDAAIAGAMPKSAFAANAQAKVCASAVAQLLRGEPPSSPKLINTCYSLVAPEYGISIAGVYEPREGLLTDVPGAGGASPLDALPAVRAAEARYADAWFHAITQEVFG